MLCFLVMTLPLAKVHAARNSASLLTPLKPGFFLIRYRYTANTAASATITANATKAQRQTFFICVAR